MKKIVAIILLSMLLTASVLLSPAVAGAEDETNVIIIDDYTVEAVIINGEPLLLISFQYEGECLSFYWEGHIDTLPLRVSIWNSIEVIDADYLEEQASA